MPVSPYPAHLISTWTAPDGTKVAIRPIRPEDAGIERDFVKALSAEAKYMRFMSTLNELTPDMLVRFTQVDFERDMALVAVVTEGARELQIGVARYILDADGVSCEFAIVIAEAWQGLGLGRHLIARLIDIARERGLERMNGQILSANTAMLEFATKLGFRLASVRGTPQVKDATVDLANVR